MLVSNLYSVFLLKFTHYNGSLWMQRFTQYFEFSLLSFFYCVTVALVLGYISSLMSNSFRVRNYCCRSYFRVVLKSQMKWKCWNRLDVKSKRTHHKHTRVATRGVLGTVQRTNNSITKFYPDSNSTFSSFFSLHHLDRAE